MSKDIEIVQSNIAACKTQIIFYDKDNVKGLGFHNCSFYISGTANDMKVSLVLLDGGSTINLIYARLLHPMMEHTTQLIDQ